MSMRDLRVNLHNIQHQYPLSEIIRRTLVVNSSDMSLMTIKDASSPIKSRPTARKSTNSRLNLSPISESQVANFAKDGVKKNSANFLNFKDDSSFSHSNNSMKSSIEDNVTLKSVICSDNKIKITKTTSSDNPSDFLPLTNDDIITSQTVDNLIEKIDSIIPKEGSKSPKSDDKSSESDDSGCATNASSNDPQSDSLKLKLQLSTLKEIEQTNPPIKLVVSNIHDSPKIQLPVEPVTSSVNSLHSNATTSSSPMETSPMLSQTRPTANITTSIEASNVKCRSFPKKLKIEDIVETLNSKQSKLSNSFTESGFRKRSIDDSLLTPDSSPKRPKLCDSEDDIMDTNNIVSSFSKPESISSKYDEKKVKVKEIGTCTNFAYPKFMQLDTEKYLQKHFQTELDLRLKLHLKNEKYLRLKGKYESLEETFRSWIKFADDLQARVKKLAMHFHKQQETVGTLQSHHAVQKVNVAVQTEKELVERSVKNHFSKPTLNNVISRNVSPNKSTSLSRLKSPVSSKTTPCSISVPKSHSDVIDLTDDAENIASKQPRNSAGMTREVQRILQLQNAMKSANPRLSSSNVLKTNQAPSLAGVSTLHGTNRPRLRLAFPPPVSTSSICFGDQRNVRPQQVMRTPASSSPRMNNLMMMGRMPNVRPAQSVRQPLPRLQQPRNAIPARTLLPQTPYPPLPSVPAPDKLPRGSSLLPPPELKLGIKKANGGIVLSWNNIKPSPTSAKVVGYELYAFHHAPGSDKKEWKKIGDDTIAAMDLPMACTLSHFSNSNTYYFAVRGKDIYGRYGSFSKPCNSKDIT